MLCGSGQKEVTRIRPTQSPELTLQCVQHNFDQLNVINIETTNRLSHITSRARIDSRSSSLAYLAHERKEINGLLAKCQLGIYSSCLLVTAVELLESTETLLTEIKADLRKMGRENKELKATISYCIEKIHDKEGRLAAAREETRYWELLVSLNQLEYQLVLAGDDKETWNEAQQYDTKWIVEYAAPLFSRVEHILTLVDLSSISEALHIVDDLPVPESDERPTYASILEMIAKRCYEEAFYTPALELMQRVLEVRKDAYGGDHPIVAAALNCIALTYSGMKEENRAPQMAYEALSILERHPMSAKNPVILARQYTRTGQMLVSWGYSQEGIKVMKLALNLLEDLLPKEEIQWCDAVNRMARTCNEHNFYDDALTLGCEVIDYYHEKHNGLISERNPTIYEVAYTRQITSKSRSPCGWDNLTIPPPALLNRNLTVALQEVAVAFACRYEFKAAQIIDNYLTVCANASLCAEDVTLLPQLFRTDARVSKYAKPTLIGRSKDQETDKKGVLKSLANLFKSRR